MNNENKKTFKEALENIPEFQYAPSVPIVEMRPRAKQNYKIYPIDETKQIFEEIQILSDTKNLVGYDTGLKYRQEYLIDAFDFGNPVYIIIPDNIVYMSSSFIVGMFEDSTDYFETIDEFFNHYIFSCNNTMFKYILNGIKRIYINKENKSEHY